MPGLKRRLYKNWVNLCQGIKEKMKMYDFDKVIDRRNTNSFKWDILSKEGKDSEGIIPMWVADMDFCVAPAITEEMQKVVDRQIYGYQFNDDEYAETIVSWWRVR